jgi:chromosome segregation ATPase
VALRAEAETVSCRTVREKLGNVGSMGTVSKLLKQCLDEADETPASLRQLPPDLQRAILAFADQQADLARSQIAEELVASQLERAILVEDNERMSTDIEELRDQLACANSAKALTEGQVIQLTGAAARAREETTAERRALDETRVELARLQLRLDAIGRLEAELRELRVQCEALRDTCAQAEQAAAVLDAQNVALGSQVANLKGALEKGSAINERLDQKVEELTRLLDREREARVVAERELAVATAVQGMRPTASRHEKKDNGSQATLWQGDSTSGRPQVVAGDEKA